MTSRATSRTFEPLEPRLMMAVHAVLNNNDGGAGSLRQAIAGAVNGDTIDLSARTGTIALATRLWVDKSLTFVGPGAGNLTLSGRDANQVLYIAEAADSVAIRDLTIAQGRNGNSLGGGGIDSAAGELLL